MVAPGFPALYGRLKTLAKADLASEAVTDLITSIVTASHSFLRSEGQVVELRSTVPKKRYFSYRYEGRLSRPINRDLFVLDPKELQERLAAFAKGRLDHLLSTEATRTLYTLAMVFCAANDAIKGGDKKTPATYFEILIGHMFAVHLGIAPKNSIQVLAGDLKGNLPASASLSKG